MDQDTTNNDADLQRRAASARDQIAKLQETLKDREADAAKAAKAFERTAEEAAFVTSAAAKQRATIARKALANYEAEVADLLSQATEAAAKRELEKLTPQIDIEHVLGPHVAKIAGIALKARAEVQAAIAAAWADVARREQSAKRAKALMATLGDKFARIEPARIEDVTTRVTAAMQKEVGYVTQMTPERCGFLSYTPAANGFFKLDLNFAVDLESSEKGAFQPCRLSKSEQPQPPPRAALPAPSTSAPKLCFASTLSFDASSIASRTST